MKQTAVEWLFQQVNNLDWKNLIGEKKIEIFDQAKQMEKDQIQQAWIAGMRSVSIAPFEDEFYNDEAEAYYDKMRELG